MQTIKINKANNNNSKLKRIKIRMTMKLKDNYKNMIPN